MVMVQGVSSPHCDTLRVRIAGGIGLAGISTIALLGLRSPTGLYAGLFLVLVGIALAADRSLPVLLREPIVWAALVLFAWVFLRGWVDLATAETRGLEPDTRAIWHHARYTPLLPLVLGLWFAAWWRYRHLLLVLIGLSFVLYMSNDWQQLLSILPGGQREFASAFGEAGIMSATVLFLTGAAAISLARESNGYAPLPRWSLAIVAGAITIFAAFVLLASQSRAAWLAMLVVVLLFAAVGGRHFWKRADADRRKLALMIAGGAVVLLVAGLGAAWDILAGRLARDAETIAILLAGEVSREELPTGSFADRYRMFRQALIDIDRNPLWGIGPASVRDMLHEIWGKPRGGSGNYHSAWLNLLVAMGIPWTLFWLGLHAWMIWRAARELIVVERDRLFAVALVGAALVHFGTLTFQAARIWSVQGSALYLVLMTLIAAVLLRAGVRRVCLAREEPVS